MVSEITIQVPDGEYCTGCPIFRYHDKDKGFDICAKFIEKIREHDEAIIDKKCPACLKAIGERKEK